MFERADEMKKAEAEKKKSRENVNQAPPRIFRKATELHDSGLFGLMFRTHAPADTALKAAPG
jgi:hypothetical protein